ncbi:MAG: hypothetical protein GY732_04365 [Gammaproteobacteria bacterium]|nr:hypothetical protein [Gammaproteobacteria bacterium]
MMKRVIFAGVALVVSMTALAQEVLDDGSTVILPIEAQECALPSAPPPIPEVPEKADLLKAQKLVKAFQSDMQAYRDCVNQYAESPDSTLGNKQAISNAHNYSVDMEERVAAMFNEAVRAYKANLAKD